MIIHNIFTEEEDGAVIGYMCATDWECELGVADGGNRVFPTVDDALRHLKCGRSCGIVEVAVYYRRSVLKGSDPEEEAQKAEPPAG